MSRGFFDKLSGKGRAAETEARKAEVAGDLTRAAVLWVEADRADEAARIVVQQGDAENDDGRRLAAYVRAVALAPEGTPIRDVARRKRALLALAVARGGATSAAARIDLLEAARELEALGDSAAAAEAYALGGDVDGQARALVQGGEIEALEDVLERERERALGARRKKDAHVDVERLVLSGRRRDALLRAEAWAAASPEDVAAGDQLKALRARRAIGPNVAIEILGVQLALVLGDEVVVGRSEGAVLVASHAVSRRHLVIARAEGGVVARDLGSRNGTTLRGMRIAGAIPVDLAQGLELKLGGEVPLRIAASPELAGAVSIEVGGARYVAPLGPARLSVGAWRLEAASDGWVELVTDDDPVAYAGASRLDARVPLLSGDALARARDEPSVLRIG